MKTNIDSRTRGSYILLIEIPRGVNVKVGALGPLTFPQGFYAYCGSAMSGLAARINRHLRREKKVRWHVDYLVAKGRIREVMCAVANERLECRLAEDLCNAFNTYPGFGSSDCTCPSHLFFSQDFPALQEKAAAVFKGLLYGRELIIEEY
jgi:sugar fermentation stimulation protein A